MPVVPLGFSADHLLEPRTSNLEPRASSFPQVQPLRRLPLTSPASPALAGRACVMSFQDLVLRLHTILSVVVCGSWMMDATSSDCRG